MPRDQTKTCTHGKLISTELLYGLKILASIAAASILAKVSRDRCLYELDREYPQYQFAKHKGYGTKLHYEMLAQYGISAVHRKTFLKNLSRHVK